MTLQQYQAILLDCTKQDTQLGLLTIWVNVAMTELQRRRSWRFMKATIPLTIATGNGTVELPSNYKEPQSGINPLRGTDASVPGGFVNWFLYSPQEINRLLEIQVGAPDRKACIVPDGEGGWEMQVQGQVGSTVNFLFDIYQYLPPLANPTDSNAFTNEYPIMLLEQAKVYTLRHVATPEAVQASEAAQQEVERQFQIASADDAYREVRGRRMRMSGF